MSDEAPYQTRVAEWIKEAFGHAAAADPVERRNRFFEEAAELFQAVGGTAEDADELVAYTFRRPDGDVHQEVGGVMTTLAALCAAASLDMDIAGEVELARCWGNIDRIRAKQAAKPKVGPLPGCDATTTRPPACNWHNMQPGQRGWHVSPRPGGWDVSPVFGAEYVAPESEQDAQTMDEATFHGHVIRISTDVYVSMKGNAGDAIAMFTACALQVGRYAGIGDAGTIETFNAAATTLVSDNPPAKPH